MTPLSLSLSAQCVICLLILLSPLAIMVHVIDVVYLQ